MKSQKRYERINDIMNRYTSGNVIKLEQLAEEVGISVRMLNYHIEHMRQELNAPFEYDPKLKGWRYSEPYDIVDGMPFRKQEVVMLRIFMEMMEKSGQFKDFTPLPTVVQRINRASKRWATDTVPEKAIYFDPIPQYTGAKHLDFFLSAIEQHKSVEFYYQAFHATTAKLVPFHPWFLRHYDRRWYVGGWSNDPAELFVRTFPLERIQGTPTATGFFHDKPAQYNAQTYWQNIYGITVPPNGKVEDIVLRFTAIQGAYFLSTPFYEPFTVLEKTEEHLIIQLQLIPNIDLQRKLASLANDVTVLAPESLRREMATFFQRALAELQDET